MTESKRFAIAMTGGPTAVVNSSLAGFATRALRHGELFGVLNGPLGLVEASFMRIDKSNIDLIIRSSSSPGAYLGAGRLHMSQDKLEGILEGLARNSINRLALIGGNGTMSLCRRLAELVDEQQSDIKIVGIPKTVDNDLDGTDHSPGFPSAARCLVTLVRDLDMDHEAMTSIEPVRIIETLGRNVGWLAASTFLARRGGNSGPHVVLLPERNFDETEFLKMIEDSVKKHGRALVVTAEGAAGELTGSIFETEVYDRPIQGGVGGKLSKLLYDALGLRSRVEVPGLIQRSCSSSVSRQDKAEAWAVGEWGARVLSDNESGVMVSIGTGAPNYTVDGRKIHIGTVALSEASGRNRRVPAKWSQSATEIPEGLATWLMPLMDLNAKNWKSSVGES